LFVVSFVGVLLLTQAFLDHGAHVTPRLWAPMRGIFLAIVVALAYRWLAPYLHARRAAVVLAIAAAALVWSGWSVQRHWFSVHGPHNDGPVDVALQDLPRDSLVLSQDTARVYMSDGRTSYSLPDHRMYMTGAPNRRVDQELAEWVEILNTRGGYLDIERSFVPRSVVSIEELRRYVNSRLIASSPDRQLYEVLPTG
jgi:hypothetical protein